VRTGCSTDGRWHRLRLQRRIRRRILRRIRCTLRCLAKRNMRLENFRKQLTFWNHFWKLCILTQWN